jgi:hypothetical protein
MDDESCPGSWSEAWEGLYGVKNDQTHMDLGPLDPLTCKSIGQDERQAIMFSSNRIRVWEVDGSEEVESPDTNSTLMDVAVSVIWSQTHVTMEAVRRQGITELDRTLEMAEETMQHCAPGISTDIRLDKKDEMRRLNQGWMGLVIFTRRER